MNKNFKILKVATCFMLTLTLIITLMQAKTTINAKAYTAGTVESGKYKAAILIETNTGEILYQRNMNGILPQASLTKLMTYYTFMQYAERMGLDFKKKITIDVKSFNIPLGGTQIALKKGDVVSVNELITSLLVVSANDSAEALKRIYNSNGNNMIADMNKLSNQLGFHNSKFVSVSGLTEKVGNNKKYNVTTAYELARLSCLLLKKYPEILNITSKASCIANGKKYISTNKLLKYSGFDGLKTGRTVEAGYCVAATSNVTEDIGQGKYTRLLAIVLGCPTDAARFNEAKKLIDYGTTNYVNYKAVSKESDIRIENEYYKNNYIKCSTKEDVHILKSINDPATKVIEFTNKLNANIKKGEKIGIVKIHAGNKEVNAEIFATDNYKRKILPLRIIISIKNFFGGLF